MSRQIIKTLILFLWCASVSSNAFSGISNHLGTSNEFGNRNKNRASKSYENGSDGMDLDRGIKFIENYLLKNPDWKNEAWLLRADLHKSVGDKNPGESLEFYSKGIAASKEKKYSDALFYYKKSMELDPFFPWSANNLAWEHATCPDPNIRDGKKAVEYARIAIENTNTPVADFIGTLAAAYATKGDYRKAVYFCKEAQKIFPTANRKIMLKKFLSKKNYIDYYDPPVKSETIYSKGFGKTKWGMTKLYVISLYPEATFSNNDHLILPGAEIAGLNATVHLHFFNDMLYKAAIHFEKDKVFYDGKKYLEKYLFKKYGQPDLITNDKEFNWEKSDTTIKYTFSQQSSGANIILVNKKISMTIAERDEYRNSQ